MFSESGKCLKLTPNPILRYLGDDQEQYSHEPIRPSLNIEMNQRHINIELGSSMSVQNAAHEPGYISSLPVVVGEKLCLIKHDKETTRLVRDDRVADMKGHDIYSCRMPFRPSCRYKKASWPINQQRTGKSQERCGSVGV